MLFLPTIVYAQEANEEAGQYKGLITDQYGNAIPDVIVTIKKSDFLTTTDEEGLYTYPFTYGMVIAFSHPDYMYKELTLKKGISENKTLKVVMNQKFLKNPDQLTVLYNKRDKESYLGSASTVYTDQLTSTMSNNILAPLAGRIAGMDIQQLAGINGTYTTVNTNNDNFGNWYAVLGSGIMGDNNGYYSYGARGRTPVVVVDGIQREILDLDFEAIESVSLQKDALSTIGLGMRSSNGALVITTKEPIKQGFQVSFTGKFGFQEALKRPKAVDSYTYGLLLNEALLNDGKEAAYTYDDLQKFKDGSSPYTHPNVDWYNTVMKKHATTQTYNLNAAGGGKMAQFFVNLAYYETNGLYRTDNSVPYNTNYQQQRYSITSKINVNVTDDFTAGVSVIARVIEGNQPGGGYSGILDNVKNIPNNAFPIYNPNGTFGATERWNVNPYAQTMRYGYMLDNTRDLLSTVNLKYDFHKVLKGLSVKAMGNISTQSRTTTDRFRKDNVFEYVVPTTGNPYYVSRGSSDSQRNKFNPIGNYQSLFGSLSVDYDNRFGEHGVSGSIGGDTYSITPNSDLPYYVTNLLAQAKYDYARKYFAEAAITHGYSNRYAPGNKWDTYYAFGLGWDISKENFMAELDWLNKWKLRGTFGRTGNGIYNTGYYTWKNTYGGTGVNYNLGNNYDNNGLSGNGQAENGSLPNVNMRPEHARKLNIGTDIAVFNNKLVFNMDFYLDNYFDILQQRGGSIELIGRSYPSENIGKRRFRGLELTATYQDNIGNVNYYITGNWSTAKSKLIFFDEEEKENAFNRTTGKPVNVMWGYVADGFFNSQEEIDDPNAAWLTGYTPKAGDLRYKDLNGDGIIDELDQTAIGNTKPVSYFGLNFGLEYKNLELSVLFQGRYNYDLYLGDGAMMQGLSWNWDAYGNIYSHMLNRWTPETAETATYPRLIAGQIYNNNNVGSSFYVKSGNYIRLKNVYLGYTLPDNFSRNYLGGLRVKIFVTGDNLLTWTKQDLVDPEVTNMSSYPALRTFTTGINIRF